MSKYNLKHWHLTQRWIICSVCFNDLCSAGSKYPYLYPRISLWRHMSIFAFKIILHLSVWSITVQANNKNIKGSHYWAFPREYKRISLDKGQVIRKAFSCHDVICVSLTNLPPPPTPPYTNGRHFGRRHFQMKFLVIKIVEFQLKFHWNLFPRA